MNPFESLLKSRKFLLLILDTVISIVLFFIGQFTSPEVQEGTKFLIATLQPVFVTIIGAIAYEDTHQTMK
jgi:drug/metabolite transporter (DMT)-like permease